MLKDIEAWVCSWDEEGARKQCEAIEGLCGVKAYWLCLYDHESRVVNEALRRCQSEFFWYVESDVDLLHPETAEVLLDVMKGNPQVGLIRPNREAEPKNFNLRPFRKYMDDGTAWLYRMSVGAKWDEEMMFAGWQDLDWGDEVEYRGYWNILDPRISVWKHPTKYGSWSFYRRAMSGRNRLLLEAKWFWVGRDKWQGVDHYNAHCHPDKCIPSIYELFCKSNEWLDAFASSVNYEHPHILVGGGNPPGNTDWKLSDIVV